MSRTLTLTTHSARSTQALGERLGRVLRGGEVVELVSDVGGGKTTLVQGIARGIDSQDSVMSPTFTISRIYRGTDLELHHFDFYRLSDPGIMAAELAESLANKDVSVVIEWSDIVSSILPHDRLRIEITACDPANPDHRQLSVACLGSHHAYVLEALV